MLTLAPSCRALACVQRDLAPGPSLTFVNIICPDLIVNKVTEEQNRPLMDAFCRVSS